MGQWKEIYLQSNWQGFNLVATFYALNTLLMSLRAVKLCKAGTECLSAPVEYLIQKGFELKYSKISL